MNAYYTESFEKLPSEKKERILQSAILEFAEKGYEAANVNVIAAGAGISIGSVYKYFPGKEALYLTIISHCIETLKAVLEEIMTADDDLFGRIGKIIRAIQSYSRSNMHMTRLYNEMATESRSDLVRKAVTEMENATAAAYTGIMKEAGKSGLIRADLDPALAAFFMDNLFMSLQFSYSCEYYRERLKIYAGSDVFDDDERVAENLMKFMRRALGAEGE